MRRLTEGWFSFGGVKCDDMGIKLLEMPKRRKAKANGALLTAAGRDGDLWDGENSYKAWDMTVKCETTDECSETAVRGWLDGAHELIFSDSQNLAYDAQVIDTVDFTPKNILFDTQLVTIPFHVQPLRRLIPEVPAFSVYNGQIVNNPGTAPSLPRITIAGNGDFSLTIGLQTIFFQDVTGGIIIDSELGDALTYDGALPANDKISGPLYRMRPGANIVSWLIDTGGSISSVTIEPRWRCL